MKRLISVLIVFTFFVSTIAAVLAEDAFDDVVLDITSIPEINNLYFF